MKVRLDHALSAKSYRQRSRFSSNDFSLMAFSWWAWVSQIPVVDSGGSLDPVCGSWGCT